MPRRSRADLSVVVPLSTTRRPPPPDELTAEQGEVWRASVAAMPADWFGRETYPLLAAYCRHVCRSRWLAQEIDANADRILKLDGGVAMLDKLFGMAERESRAVMAHARSLRLTIQAKLDAKSAGRQANGPARGYYDHAEGDDDY
jgi:hypothetical protein